MAHRNSGRDETVADIIEEVAGGGSSRPPSTPLPLLPAFIHATAAASLVCMLAIGLGAQGTPIQWAYSLSIVFYLLVRIGLGEQSAAHLIGPACTLVPILDMLGMIFAPPSPAKLEVFFERRELVLVPSLCFGLVAGAHRRQRDAYRALALLGLSWFIGWLQMGDARFLYLYIAIVMLPALLGIAIAFYGLESMTHAQNMKQMCGRFEEARRREITATMLDRLRASQADTAKEGGLDGAGGREASTKTGRRRVDRDG